MDILATKAGIHQHQPVAIRLNQQTVTDQMCFQAFTESIIERAAQRTHTATVKVVNFHRASIGTMGIFLRGYALSGAQHISLAIECREG